MNTRHDADRRSHRPATRARIEHELGSAITVIRGYLRMLADGRAGALGREQRRFVREAYKQVDFMCRLMADLRAEDEAVAARLETRPTCVPELVRATVDAALPVLEERKLQVQLAVEAEIPTVPLDAVRFEQVVMNLLQNAAKFAPEGSTVRVQLDLSESCEGTRVHLSVTDEGPGIAPEEADQIFLPYVRGLAAEETPGQGLGLAICREIVEAHGGTIEVVPSHRGAHLRVTLQTEEGKTRG